MIPRIPSNTWRFFDCRSGISIPNAFRPPPIMAAMIQATPAVIRVVLKLASQDKAVALYIVPNEAKVH